MRRLIAAAAALVLLAGARGARAAEPRAGEYEFGRALIEKLGYADLAREHFEGLVRKGGSGQLEGILGMGTLKKHLASRAAADAERTRLYSEAIAHFKEFLRKCGERSRLRPTAARELAGVHLAHVEALVRQIKSETDAAGLAELVSSAEKLFDGALKSLVEEALRASEKASEAPASVRPLEAAFVASQRVLNMMLKKTDIYAKGSARRSEHVKAVIAEADAAIERFLEYDLVVKWFELAKGRAFGQIGDYERACEQGFDPVIALDPRRIPAAARPYVHTLRKQALYLKARCAHETAHHKDAVSTVDLMIALEYRDSIKEAIGKGAVVVKADSLRDLERFSEAMRSLEPIVKHTKEGEPWRNTVHQKRGGIWKTAAAAGARLDAGPAELRSAGLGLYRLKDYEQSVAAYRQAVAAARDPETPYLDRLRWEPRCWFEMGLAYHKMQLLNESALCFETVLDEFSPRVLGERFASEARWRSALHKIRERVEAGEYAGRLRPNVYVELYKEIGKRRPYSEIFPEIDDKVARSAGNVLKVMGGERARSGAGGDDAMYIRFLEKVVEVDPSMASDIQYFKHKMLCEHGEDALDEARKLLKADPEAAAKALRRGVKTMQLGASGLQEVARTSARREDALYRAADACYRIVSALDAARKKIEGVTPGEIEDFGRRALAGYEAYERFAAGTPAPSVQSGKVRRSRRSNVCLARPLIHLAMGDARKAIAGCRRYLATDGRNAAHDPLVMWTEFKAHRRLARAANAPLAQMDEGLKGMSSLARAMKSHSKAKRFHMTAGNYLAATYIESANVLIRRRRERSTAEPAAAEGRSALEKELTLLDRRIRAYRLAGAEWMKEVLGGKPTMQKLGYVGNVFFELRMYSEARAMYDRLLGTYDPDGDLQTREIRRGDFAEMREKIWYDSERKLKRARADFDLIADCIFDAQGVREMPIEKRTENLRDYDRAIEVIARMVGEKGYARDIEPKADLEAVRAELEKRLAFLFAARRIGKCSLHLAREAEARAETKAALTDWRRARDTFAGLLDYWHADVEIRFGLARAHAALGASDPASRAKARDIYIEIADKVAEKSDHWLAANRELSEVFLAMGEAQKAAAFPLKLKLTMPEYARKHWPDLDEFIERCEAAGAKISLAESAEPDGRAVYGAHSEIEDEYRKSVRAAKRALELGDITEAECRSRLRRAERVRAGILKERARSHERDAVTAAYFEKLDRAEWDGGTKRGAAEAELLRKEAQRWRDAEIKKLEAKWRAEDAGGAGE